MPVRASAVLSMSAPTKIMKIMPLVTAVDSKARRRPAHPISPRPMPAIRVSKAPTAAPSTAVNTPP
jgi:hypothetical protein